MGTTHPDSDALHHALNYSCIRVSDSIYITFEESYNCCCHTVRSRAFQPAEKSEKFGVMTTEQARDAAAGTAATEVEPVSSPRSKPVPVPADQADAADANTDKTNTNVQEPHVPQGQEQAKMTVTDNQLRSALLRTGQRQHVDRADDDEDDHNDDDAQSHRSRSDLDEGNEDEVSQKHQSLLAQMSQMSHQAAKAAQAPQLHPQTAQTARGRSPKPPGHPGEVPVQGKRIPFGHRRDVA